MANKTGYLKLCFIFIMIVLVGNLIEAAHYVVGYVQDAKDGTISNGHEVIIWNPVNGIIDNLTDIVGPLGASGNNNLFMIDCELLDIPCDVGDELYAKVIDSGDNYLSYTVATFVSGLGYDVFDNLSLNSPPQSILNYPLDQDNRSTIMIEFNCSGIDLDSNLGNVSLFGNWSGGWHLNETLDLSGNYGSASFFKNISEGIYEWNCLVSDNLSVYDLYDNNRTLFVDGTPPEIGSVLVNESYVCGDLNSVVINCSVSDSFTGLSSVLIEATSPLGKQNYSASLLFGNTYYSEVSLDVIGEWGFRCIANDSANNLAMDDSINVTVFTNSPDLVILSSDMNLSDWSPIENQLVSINATVMNLGCGDANNFLVGFFKGDPEISSQQIGSNLTVSVVGLSSIPIGINWNAEIGPNNLFVFADIGDLVVESNESNNKANLSLDITSWQEFYGDVFIDKLLSDGGLFNLSGWGANGVFGGNIFVTDLGSDIDWSNLQAIGIDSNNNSVEGDFEDLDVLFGSEGYVDSINNTFSSYGLVNFTVHKKVIADVRVVNSTNNSNFFTGILWDMSDDGNGQFDPSEKEDIVFATQINLGKDGKYGTNDYEIKIPVRLRDLDLSDTSDIYFYYDLA